MKNTVNRIFNNAINPITRYGNIFKSIAIIAIISLLFFSCEEKKAKEETLYPSDLHVIDLRGLLLENGKDEIKMFSSTDRIEYIPLDTFPEISGCGDILLTDNHIFLSKAKDLIMYDCNGKYQRHIEGEDYISSLFYNEYTHEVYVMGKGNVWILDEKSGEPVGDTKTLYKTASHTQLYPLASDRFLALFGRDNFYVTKTRAAICDNKGQLLTDSVLLTPDEIEKHVCWWDGGTYVMNDANKNYLFFTYFPGNPYQTIFKASQDKIVPIYYLDIESDACLLEVWEFKGCLYFIFSYWLRGYGDVYRNLTLATFNMETHELKSKRLYKELIDWSAKYGIENNIDHGLPILCMKHSYARKAMLDLIGSWHVLGYVKQNKIKDNAPEFLKQMKGDSPPVISVIRYD